MSLVGSQEERREERSDEAQDDADRRAHRDEADAEVGRGNDPESEPTPHDREGGAGSRPLDGLVCVGEKTEGDDAADLRQHCGAHTDDRTEKRKGGRPPLPWVAR